MWVEPLEAIKETSCGSTRTITILWKLVLAVSSLKLFTQVQMKDGFTSNEIVTYGNLGMQHKAREP